MPAQDWALPLPCGPSITAGGSRQSHGRVPKYGNSTRCAERLNFSWNHTTAQFIGRDITASWDCPEWFTECAAVTQVIEGTATYRGAGHPAKVLVDLILIDDEVLYLSWVDFGFACPWYPTFEAALEANPFPLPFNGMDWPDQDCIFAPAP